MVKGKDIDIQQTVRISRQAIHELHFAPRPRDWLCAFSIDRLSSANSETYISG